LTAASAGRNGVAGVDALWDELVRQQGDGTARAWLSLAAGGVLAAPQGHGGDDVMAQAGRALLDGCATALAAGAEPTALREAYEALSLALLGVEDRA
jgi:hypothetical protein